MLVRKSARIPAVMWTDTAEFRNPNCHLDTPETLDYRFLRSATQLLLVHILSGTVMRDRTGR